MKIKDRQQIERRKQEMIAEAKKIILSEGIEGLSMRKLATSLHQSQGIIYHYFKDKDDLLLTIVKEGYTAILNVITQSMDAKLLPDEQLYCTLNHYMNAMMTYKEIFLIIMRSKNPLLQKHTAILRKGTRQDRTSINLLCECIEAGVKKHIFFCNDVELRAQCIWSAVYGLLERCIIEDIDLINRECLFHEHVSMLIMALKQGKEGIK